MLAPRFHRILIGDKRRVLYTALFQSPSKPSGFRLFSVWRTKDCFHHRTLASIPNSSYPASHQYQGENRLPLTPFFTNLNLVTRSYSAAPNHRPNENEPKETQNQNTDSKSAAGTGANVDDEQSQVDKVGEEEDEKPKGIFARFKVAYKNYGKALVGVHLVTSSVWFGSFYYAAYTGLDIVPILKWIGFSDRIISPFESSGVGNIAVAYLLYKIATPARYTVTILATQYTVRYLRHLGYMQPVPQGSRLRDLVKESGQQVKGKYEDLKEDIKDKKDEYREKYEDKKDEYREKYEDKKDEYREKYEDKKDEYREKYEDKMEHYKDKLEGTKDKVKGKLKQ